MTLKLFISVCSLFAPSWDAFHSKFYLNRCFQYQPRALHLLQMFCCNWENDSQWRQRKNCLLWIVYLQWKDNCCINTTLFECHCLFKCLFVFMGLFTEIKQVSKKLTSWVIGFWLNSSIKSPCYTFNNEIIRHWISNSM